MKKTLQKRTAQVDSVVRLPRISVEALECRTLLSAAGVPKVSHHFNFDTQDPIFRTIAVSAPSGSCDVILPTGSNSLNILALSSGGTTAWRADDQGHAVLSGRVIQLSSDGSSTTEDVVVTIDGSTTTSDSKDKNGDGSTDAPSDPNSGNSGSTSTGSGSRVGKPFIVHPTTGGQTPIAGPTLPDTGSAQPNVARPTPQPVDPTTSNTPTSTSPAVTPLAMTPASQGFTPAPAGSAPGTSVTNVRTIPGSAAGTNYSAASFGISSPVAHDLSHTAEHTFATLAVITPPISFLTASNLPADAAAAPVQVATGAVHVSDIAGDATAPATYIAAATPSLPARIAYNFVRLDAAAFHDSAGAFAAELAALNVASTGQSHTRAWAITAGVLSTDIALLIYWHRQAKRRKLLLKTDKAV